jgi:5-(aminomethyl)-3-furanmethanol phosphate kinase
MMHPPPLVMKLGGSLFDLPDLKSRFEKWRTTLGDRRILLVPGGGPACDVIRQYDRTHALGESASHWLAIGMMGINARFLAALLGCGVVASPHNADASLQILDVEPFLRNEDSLPESWQVTSDAIAARVAEVVGGELHLLKSVDLPTSVDWPMAASQNLVDAAFPAIVARSGIRVGWTNLRAASFADCHFAPSGTDVRRAG